MVDGLGAGINNDQLSNVVRLMAPIQIGAVKIQRLVQEAGTDTGIHHQAGRTEVCAVADGHGGFPDLAGLIQEVVAGGGCAD